MSLVAYGSSDESENEENFNEEPPKAQQNQKILLQDVNNKTKLQLPTPKSEQVNNLNGDSIKNINESKLNFDVIPKPKLNNVDINDIKEVHIVPVSTKTNYGNIEKPPKKKGPTRISIPSLSDFQDLDEENDNKHRIKRQPSQKKSGLISILPPPKSSPVTTNTSLMVPNVLTKKPSEIKQSSQLKTTVFQNTKKIESSIIKIESKKQTASTLTSLSNYKSDSEDEDDRESTKLDFFSLSNSTNIIEDLPLSKDEINTTIASPLSKFNNVEENSVEENSVEENSVEEEKSDKILTSNVINLPKEEILLKNKAEVGPKLPIPEQEYNVDSEGNVAFDEKAIEYLCGKRGVKRKNEFNNVDIIEINGEDIKPDEREWMIKALTDESIQKPISIGSGPGGQSKKKHQITYLAHQAKAMELELKNQWAQNKASRQQTRSKYGF